MYTNVELWDTFCIHFVYILYSSIVYILHNFCIQNIYITFMLVQVKFNSKVIDNMNGFKY